MFETSNFSARSFFISHHFIDRMSNIMLKGNEQAKNNDHIDLSKLPQNMDMTAESITANVHAINANCQDDRMKFIFKSLVNHMHDFVRETSLTTEEWMTAINFLTETGKMCSDIRQEFILLSDTLGVSTLVDSINNAKPPGATEATVLGPFYTDDAHEMEKGDSIASEGKGDYMFVEGVVTDLRGNHIPNATIDTWETDGNGQYDNQYESREEPDCRGRLHSTEDGSYAFRAVVPVSYPIPNDGTVGEMIRKLGRHVFRPAHLHIRINAPGYEELITALYFKGPYITSDAVFGVKSSLIVEPKVINDLSISKARGFKEPKPHLYLKHDFVLATVEECVEARRNAEFHTGHDSIHLIISHTNNLSKEYFASHWVTTIYEHPNHFYQPSLLAPHHHIMDGPPRGKRFYLLGFPIAKSTAPAFHNHCFQSWHTGTPNTFETWSSSKVIDDLLRVCFQEEFGGAALARPLQQAIISHLESSPESKATGTCNTIVKVPTISGSRLVAQNTEILGVRNALIGGLRLQFPTLNIRCEASYRPSKKRASPAGLVIGGGAKARSAIYALSLLGLHPIFLLNRDDEEIECLMNFFPNLKKKKGLIYLKNPTDVVKYLSKPISPMVLMVVGAIPSVAPVTIEEHTLYTTLSAVMKIPYKPLSQLGQPLPFPLKCLFLEMTSTPRVTHLLQMATSHGWFAIDGMQSMMEERLAQQRMWFTSTPTLEAGSAVNVFDPEVEASARDLCENLKPSRRPGIEIDRARMKH